MHVKHTATASCFLPTNLQKEQNLSSEFCVISMVFMTLFNQWFRVKSSIFEICTTSSHIGQIMHSLLLPNFELAHEVHMECRHGKSLGSLSISWQNTQLRKSLQKSFSKSDILQKDTSWHNLKSCCCEAYLKDFKRLWSENQ